LRIAHRPLFRRDKRVTVLPTPRALGDDVRAEKGELLELETLPNPYFPLVPSPRAAPFSFSFFFGVGENSIK
jgi:hypothetical protein